MIAMHACPTTPSPASQLRPIASPSRRFAVTDTALTAATQRQVRAALLGGRAVVSYLQEPQPHRIPLSFALGAASQVGIEVTTRRGWRIFVSIGQATALLVGRAVESQLPRLSRTLPIFDRLPTDCTASGKQVVYALGVNQVLPVSARLRWRWSDGQEERPVAMMTTEEAYTRGFRLQARASLPRAAQSVEPAWLLASCGVCVGMRRGVVVSWEGFLPLAALAQALTGRFGTLPSLLPLATAAD